jgi:hypothetical protein
MKRRVDATIGWYLALASLQGLETAAHLEGSWLWPYLRTWSYWQLLCRIGLSAEEGTEVRSALFSTVASVGVAVLFLVVCCLGRWLMGDKFTWLALLLGLPSVTVMPSPHPPGGPGTTLSMSLEILWFIVLAAAVVYAFFVQPGWRNALFVILVAAVLGDLLPDTASGVAVLVAMVGVWTVLAMRRRRLVGAG